MSAPPRRTRRAAGPLGAVIALALAAILLAGCSGEDAQSPDPAASAAEPRASVRYVVPAPRDADEREIVDLLRDEAQVGAFVRAVRESFVLPRPVTYRITRADAGPLYDPGRREVVLPLSFAESVYEVLDASGYYPDEDDLEGAVADAIVFVLLHETGHLLVDQLDLPITGREEDAVDRLATVIALETVDEGVDLALAGADLFAAYAEGRTEFADEEFFDEHSLDEQRFADITCLVYGSDPQELQDVAQDAEIPARRRALCPGEYEAARDGWFALLDEHLRE